MSSVFRRYSGADGMRCRADLHTHSTASDGQYTPRQLVYQAQAAGIACLAITDHDTTDGLEEGIRAGGELGIAVVRGVELGAKEDRHLHILGLGFRAEHPALEALCRIGSDLLHAGVDLTLRIVPGGSHCGASWAERVPLFFLCLGV